jgi:nuclear polyadenylated RNA-binding protein NAB2
MRDDAPVPIPSQQPSGRTNGRSLLERVGPSPKYQHQNGSHQLPQQQYDPIQAQIDAVTGAAMGMNPNAPNFIPQQGANMGMPGANPLAFQEMLGAQMALMAQMAMSMGIPPMGMMNGTGNGFAGSIPGNFQGAQMNGNGYGMGGRGRGRGGARGGSSRGGPPGHVNGVGRDQPSYASQSPTPTPQPPTSASNEVVSPQPVPSAAVQTITAPANRIHYPERPGTPTLCKFGMTCTNPVCRYSHPSPAATAESGLVLSNEPCEKGIKCEDKDCTKAHASPAILNPNGTSI